MNTKNTLQYYYDRKAENGTTLTDKETEYLLKSARSKFRDEAIEEGLECGWEPFELEHGYIFSDLCIAGIFDLKTFDLENKIGDKVITVLDCMDDLNYLHGIEGTQDVLLARAKEYNELLLPELHNEICRFVEEPNETKTPFCIPIKNKNNLILLDELKAIKEIVEA